ncbi:RimJ/RimL family protein N-acetyltransferase [Oxalobacteraceae bacterium GrIS 1.11]
MQIQRLIPSQAPAYRALMLDAYALHPEAFSSSVVERGALPLAWWQARLDPAPLARELVLGALCEGELAGVAGLSFDGREKARHKATLFGMYIAPRWRRHGYARQLLGAALAQAVARPGVELLQLTVTQGNHAAQALYETCGFVQFGLEPHALALDGQYVSKAHMWRALDWR